MLNIRRILAPVDFERCSRASLEQALALAQAYGASVDALHVWMSPAYVAPSIAVLQGPGREQTLAQVADAEARRQFEDFLKTIEKPEGVELKTIVTYGVTHEVILSMAPDYDVLVLGTHGRGGVAHLVLGSVVEKVLRGSPRPVLTVRG